MEDIRIPIDRPLKRALFWGIQLMLWVLVFGFFYMTFIRLLPAETAIARSLVAIVVLAAVFYTNALVLVNKLLERRRWAWYLICAVLLMMVAMRLRFFIDHRLLHVQLPPALAALARTRRGLAFLPVFFTVIISTFYQLLLNRYRAEQAYLYRINELNEASLRLLKAQINPHFLFNHLNNIYSLIMTDAQQAGDAVLQLSALLRYAIYKSGQTDVTLQEEWQQLKHLAALYSVKDSALDVSLEGPEQTYGARMEPMILFPIAENCFKHCDNTVNPDAFIRISLTVTPGEIVFCTANTTFPAGTSVAHSGGVGLHNVLQRLEQRYRGHFTFEHGLSAGQVYETRLAIQWNRTGNA